MMKQKSQKKLVSIVALIVAVLMVLGTLSTLLFLPALAAPSDLQSKLNSAKQEREEAQRQLQNVQGQKSNAAAEKEKIDADIKAVQTDISAIEKLIAESDAKIKDTQIKLDDAQKKCDEQTDNFKVRARVMYENGPTSYLEVLLSSTSFSDFISNIEITKSIMDYDKQILEERIETKKVIEDALTTIEQEKEAREINKQTLNEKKAALNTKKQTQTALINRLSDEEAKYKKEIAAQKAEEDRIQKQINDALKAEQAKTQTQGKSSAPSVTGTGSMTWPVPTSRNISSYYGNRLHPVYKTYKYHSGIDIAAPNGSSVVAADSGTVMFAGYSSSYGNYIVLSHGKGITTLYAHNSRLLVSVGQTVSRGQEIAKVGMTGVATGYHCHFEVSVNGQRTDPMSYVH